MAPDWSLETRTRLDEMSEFLAAAGVADWPDIPGYLHPEVNPVHVSALEAAKRGVAFVTYDYGIDGVSIEISKYADCCEALLSDDDRSTPIHLIGGDRSSSVSNASQQSAYFDISIEAPSMP